VEWNKQGGKATWGSRTHERRILTSADLPTDSSSSRHTTGGPPTGKDERWS